MAVGEDVLVFVYHVRLPSQQAFVRGERHAGDKPTVCGDLIWATKGGKEGERREGAASTRNTVVEGKMEKCRVRWRMLGAWRERETGKGGGGKCR